MTFVRPIQLGFHRSKTTFMSCFSSLVRNSKPLFSSSASAPMHVMKGATRNPLSFSFNFVTVWNASHTCFHFLQFFESFPFNSNRPGGGTFDVKVVVKVVVLNQRSSQSQSQSQGCLPAL